VMCLVSRDAMVMEILVGVFGIWFTEVICGDTMVVIYIRDELSGS